MTQQNFDPKQALEALADLHFGKVRQPLSVLIPQLKELKTYVTYNWSSLTPVDKLRAKAIDYRYRQKSKVTNLVRGFRWWLLRLKYGNAMVESLIDDYYSLMEEISFQFVYETKEFQDELTDAINEALNLINNEEKQK